MNNNRLRMLLVSLLSLVQGITACGQEKFDQMVDRLCSQTVPTITPKALQSQLEQHGSQKIYVLDTRESNEFEVSHLQNARSVGYKKFSIEALHDVPKDAMLVTYCTVGYRSEKIGEQLLKAGYKNVHNLYGGIINWSNEGQILYNNTQKTTPKVHTYSKSWGKWLTKGEKIYE